MVSSTLTLLTLQNPNKTVIVKTKKAAFVPPFLYHQSARYLNSATTCS